MLQQAKLIELAELTTVPHEILSKTSKTMMESVYTTIMQLLVAQLLFPIKIVFL
jgi:hypothetical protein